MASSAVQKVDQSSVFVVQSKLCKVSLYNNVLTWEDNSSVTQERHHVIMVDVLSVKLQHKDCGTCGASDAWNNDDSHLLSKHHSFVLYYVKRKHSHRWKCERLSFYNPEPKLISSWVTTIQGIIKGFTNRPKCLLTFINPISGKKKGPILYEKYGRHLFDLAGVKVEAIVTERQNHARDIVRNGSLQAYDGIITVGGDGMVSEVINGLVFRLLAEKNISPDDENFTIPSIPWTIGILPCGSTDTTVCTTHGTNDFETAVLHIILGETVGADVGTIHSGDILLKVYTTALSYGYFGDVIKKSENMRWLGPKRYELAGAMTLMKNKGYKGEISMLLDVESSPSDNDICCQTCKRCSSVTNHKGKRFNTKWVTLSGLFVGVNTFCMPCICNLSPNGPAPFSHLGDGCCDVFLVRKTSRFNMVKFLLKMGGPSWAAMELPFVESYRVREYRFKPLNDDKPTRQHHPLTEDSVWNCDGEVISEPEIRVKIHYQPLRIFSSRKSQDAGTGTSCCCCKKN